jgi:hypothetical protein
MNNPLVREPAPKVIALEPAPKEIALVSDVESLGGGKIVVLSAKERSMAFVEDVFVEEVLSKELVAVSIFLAGTAAT